MKDQIKETFINECLTDKSWDFGNKVLYDLCENNPSHDQSEKIIAKVWLIGRSYAVALERFKRVSEDVDINTFYTKSIPETFKNSNIDIRLSDLKKFKNITKDNLLGILEVHQYLTKVLTEITRHNNRSFCSKYLHFHLPDLFFIYDSMAYESLSKFKNETIDDLKKAIHWSKVDKEYANFCCKCLAFKLKIEEEYSMTLSNRQLDNLLIKAHIQKFIPF